MSIDATRWAWQQRCGRVSDKVVLLSMADRADKNHTCHPSIARLALDTELDRKTVIAAIARLEDAGRVVASRAIGAVTKYRLVVVPDGHNTSTKNGTGTSTKNGTGTSTKSGIGTSTKNGTGEGANQYQKRDRYQKRDQYQKRDPDQYQKRYSNQYQKRDAEPISEPISEPKEKGGKRKKTAKRATTRFTPPTVEAVRTYCQERKNGVDAERFVDFYTAKGWVVGTSRMKDWKAAVRTWERRNEHDAGQKSGNGRRQSVTEAVARVDRLIGDGGLVDDGEWP